MRFPNIIAAFIIFGLTGCSSLKLKSSSNLNLTELENCYNTKIKLPDNFMKLDKILFTHSGLLGCDYSNENDEESTTASYIFINNDFTIAEFSNKFSELEELAISKRNVLHQLSILYQYGGMPEYFEESINEQKYYCYTDTNEEEGVMYSLKECFSFNDGVALNISYRHSSMGEVSLQELDDSLTSVFRTRK